MSRGFACENGEKESEGDGAGSPFLEQFCFALSIGIPWVFLKFNICVTDGGRCSPGTVHATHVCPDSHIYYRLEHPSKLGERDYKEGTERLD